jgi:hypothetical protein
MFPVRTRAVAAHNITTSSHCDQLAGLVEVPCLRFKAVPSVRDPKRAATPNGAREYAVAARPQRIEVCLIALAFVLRAKLLQRAKTLGITRRSLRL